MIHDIEIDTVLCENYKPSFALTKHLVNCEHRSIAFVCKSYIDERSSLRERFLGYCDALTDAGIPLIRTSSSTPMVVIRPVSIKTR